MDLLLHLVDQREVDIENVDLCDICNQYLAIISQVAELDLDRAGEYLVIAATLAAMKSEALLPVRTESENGMPLGEQFDPRFFSELRERLIAYRATKARAVLLRATPQLGLDVFAAKRQPAEVEDEDDSPEICGEGLQLGQLFYSMLKRIGDLTKTFRIRLEPIRVVKYMVHLVDRLNLSKGRRESFIDLVRGVDEKSSSRAKLTGAFIATLELVRRGIVTAHDEEHGFSVQYANAQGKILESEFDQSDKVIDLAAYRSESKGSESKGSESKGADSKGGESSEAELQEAV